jgi:uncharacterized membrane protein
MRIKPSFILWLGSLVVFAGTMVVSAMYLPDRVATHFDFQGQPDGWMSRSEHLLYFGAFGVGFSAFFIGLFYAMRFLPPSLMNVSNPAYWRAPENYPRACQFLFEHSFPISAMAGLFVSGLNLLLVQANLQPQPVMSSGMTLALAGAFLLGMVFWVLSLLRFFQRVPESEAMER